MSQTVLITGAAGNMGRAVVQHFLSHKFNVVTTRRAQEDMTEFDSEEGFECHVLNVLDEAAVADFVENLYKPIDLAALLVGGFAMGGIADTTGKDLEKMYRLNFESAFFMTKALHAKMSQQPEGGRIVLIGAKPALNPSAGKSTLAYALSKSLIFNLAEFVNADSAASGVACSVIVPSILDTPPNRDSMPDADFSKWVKPEEIADTIHFLTTPAGKQLRETVLKMYGQS
ncbi:MAG: SDR family NAD(P)-dependent oxidoreductase [Bacteroidota bacterium]